MDWNQARLVGLVAAGGAIGSVVRYLVSGWLTRGSFPWGTFVVNFSGTFLLSLIFFSFLQGTGLSPEIRTFLFVGFFGGYTTLSTFGVETVSLFVEGQLAYAAANVLLNAGVCLLGAFGGRAVGIGLGGS